MLFLNAEMLVTDLANIGKLSWLHWEQKNHVHNWSVQKEYGSLDDKMNRNMDR